MFKVGGVIASKTKFRRPSTKVHDVGQVWRLELRYLGKFEHRFGVMHNYEVTRVTSVKRIK